MALYTLPSKEIAARFFSPSLLNFPRSIVKEVSPQSDLPVLEKKKGTTTSEKSQN